MGSTKLTGIVATILAALTAIVAGLALYTSIQIADAERSARLALSDAATSMLSLDDLQDAILDAETGQRGYMLTGDTDYLRPYQTAIDLLNRNDDSFAALKEDGDGRLRQLTEIKLAELKETIRLFDSGSSQAALSMVQTDRGREVMAEIRQIINARQVEAGDMAAQASERAKFYTQRASFVTSLLLALLILSAMTGLFVLYQWFRARQAETVAVEVADNAERIEIIAYELDHRMKNMFTVTQSMLRQSARGLGSDVEAFATKAVSRIQAMSHAYSATGDLEEAQSLPNSVIVDRVVRAQLLDGHRLSVEGEDSRIGESAVSSLSLILHELTTNALKYGAWKANGHNDGQSSVKVSWRITDEGRYEMLWDEQQRRDVKAAPVGQGYGSKLIQACAAQLGGSVSHEWHDKGVRIRLTADPKRLGLMPINPLSASPVTVSSTPVNLT